MFLKYVTGNIRSAGNAYCENIVLELYRAKGKVRNPSSNLLRLAYAVAELGFPNRGCQNFKCPKHWKIK